MKTSVMLPDTEVLILSDGQKTVSTIRDACKGKRGVIDFWTTKCVRCPAALSNLNDQAGSKNDEEVYIACALSQGENNEDDVADFIDEWENLTHLFVKMENKDAIKQHFGFSQVPFYVVFDQEGSIVGSGDSKNFDYATTLAEVTKTSKAENQYNVSNAVPSTTANTFTLDEDF